MRERPILFSAPMVRALIAGTKTQTRRVVKPQPPEDRMHTSVDSPDRFVCPGEHTWWAGNHTQGIYHSARCPYGQPGDRLWVRETWNRTNPSGDHGVYYYRADTHFPASIGGGPIWRDALWRPSIFMPRSASRILLEVTEVRAEQLQDISEADAIAEGINELVPARNRGEGLTPGALCLAATMAVEGMPKLTRRTFLAGGMAAALGFKASPSRPWEVQATPWTRAPTPQQVYALLWQQINGAASWDANPWVWAVSFRVQEMK